MSVIFYMTTAAPAGNVNELMFLLRSWRPPSTLAHESPTCQNLEPSIVLMPPSLWPSVITLLCPCNQEKVLALKVSVTHVISWVHQDHAGPSSQFKIHNLNAICKISFSRRSMGHGNLGEHCYFAYCTWDVFVFYIHHFSYLHFIRKKNQVLEKLGKLLCYHEMIVSCIYSCPKPINTGIFALALTVFLFSALGILFIPRSFIYLFLKCINY